MFWKSLGEAPRASVGFGFAVARIINSRQSERSAPSSWWRGEKRGNSMGVMRCPQSLILLGFLVVSALPLACDSTRPVRPVTLSSGLQYRDLLLGTGEVARPGSWVLVHYVMQLADGTKIENSDRG